MRAWLIKWEWLGEQHVIAQPAVDILSARRGEGYVCQYVHQLHRLLKASLEEKLATSAYTNPLEWPYAAQVVPVAGRRSRIHCGHNPWLVALRVKNLVVQIDPDTGEETLAYEEE